MINKNKYWAKDAQWSTGQNKKGNAFEDLVERILKKMFRDYTVEHTQYVHDGGKDFCVRCKNNRDEIWIEAKNHERHLELSRFAGTFIMADVSEINQIIIFSTTKLTQGALENVGRYADRHNISVKVFHDTDIFRLLVYYDIPAFDLLLNFEELKSIYLTGEQLICPEVSCKYFRAEDMTHIYRRDIGCALKLKEICRFDIVAVEVNVRNTDITNSIDLKISFENLQRDDFKLLNAKTCELTLGGGQVYNTTYFIKILTERTKIELPVPSIESKNQKIQPDADTVTKLPCRILGETAYLGNDGTNLSELLKNLKRRQFHCVLVHGASGVGKSRFLREFISGRIELEGKSINIGTSNTFKLGFYEFAKNFILNYFNIETDTDTEEINSAKALTWKNKFLFDIVAGNASDKQNYKNDFLIWLTQIMRTHAITIVLDNAQFLGADLIDFFIELLNIMNNACCDSLICFAFNTEDMLRGTPSSNFYSYLKGEYCVPENIMEITGFDRKDARIYLRQTLDPALIRNDLDSLFEEIIDKVGTKPLVLKQIVLYLFQKNAIYFNNDCLVVSNADTLKEAISQLPDTIFEIVSTRYNLLEKTFGNSEIGDLHDFFWAVELFGELPWKVCDKIERFNSALISACTEMGFVRYDTFQNISFNHQLIGKAVLLKLQNRDYNSNPVMTNLKSSEAFLKALQKALLPYEHEFPSEKLLVDDALDYIDSQYLKRFFTKDIDYKKCSPLILPAVVNVLERRISEHNSILEPATKLSALKNLGESCEKTLGVTYTQSLMKGSIEFQFDRYEDNLPASNAFVELLKFYLYLLKTNDKTPFLERMHKISPKLNLSNEQMKDLLIWIHNRKSKNYQDMHRFEDAEESIKEAITLAKSVDDFHRLMECEVEYGNLFAYTDVNKSLSHWKLVYDFSSKVKDQIYYDEIVGLVYLGNTYIINHEIDKLNRIFTRLTELREHEQTFVYLKLLIDDFICNYYIVTALDKNCSSPKFDRNLEIVLKRFRKLGLVHQTHYYLKSVYKSLIYYKLLLKSRKNFDKNDSSFILFKNFCIELIENFASQSDAADPTYFIPVLHDIVTGFKEFGIDLDSVKALPSILQNCEVDNGRNPFMSDKNLTVKLLHFNYIW